MPLKALSGVSGSGCEAVLNGSSPNHAVGEHDTAGKTSDNVMGGSDAGRVDQAEPVQGAAATDTKNGAAAPST